MPYIPISINLCFAAWQDDDACEVLSDALEERGVIERDFTLDQTALGGVQRMKLISVALVWARYRIEAQFREHWSTEPWRTGVSFDSVMIAGPYGSIRVVADPTVPRSSPGVLSLTFED